MQTIFFRPTFEPSWLHQFLHVANLFFEETKLVTEPETSTIVVDLSIQQQGIQMFGDGSLEWQNERFETQFSMEASDQDPTQQRRMQQRVYAHLLLELLEKATKVKQGWGILTGIRPTKLYHRYFQETGSSEAAIKKMMDNHRVAREKGELLADIATVQLQTVPDLFQLKNEVSIYIGIPFCPTKCAYCTFPAYAIRRKGGRVDSFLDGLHEEMKAIGKWLKERGIRVTTIYFGGGTPTSIEPDEMDALYQTMSTSFPQLDEVREITVEAGRPDTITPEKLQVLKKWGIDRISVNPQSFTDETLRAIGRHHSVQETIDKYWLSRSHGMTNINMDLIIGLPNEGIDEFQHSLQEIEKMQPESLTIHTLSFKRASEMTRNKEKYRVADRFTAEKMMEMGRQWTAEHDYVPYYLYRQKNIVGNLENIGYAKRGKESIYNILIMEEVQTIIGLGCGASSKFIDSRTGKITQFQNPKDPAAYILSFESYIDQKIAHLERVFPNN